MLKAQMKLLIDCINEYYGTDLTIKRRDFLTLEARDMFIYFVTTNNGTISQLARVLNMSESAIKRSRARSKWQSGNDKFFKLRLADLKRIIEYKRFNG